MLSEAEYDRLAPVELRKLLDALDELDREDIQAELANDILTIELEGATPIVINSHRAARQIWMAAGRSAHHFDWLVEKEAWIAAKSGAELWATLNAALAELAPPAVSLVRG